jgi:hypothetical protein
MLTPPQGMLPKINVGVCPPIARRACFSWVRLRLRASHFLMAGVQVR